MAQNQNKHGAKQTKVPQYPIFEPIGIQHRDHINEIVSQYEPFADFTYINLYTWSVNDQTEIAFLHGNLIVKFPDYLTGLPTYSIIGTSKIDEAVATLMNITDSLNLVPEIVIKNLSTTNDYIVTEDRDGHDYMYDLDRLVKLEGKELKNKRNKLNKFKSQYGERISFEVTDNINLTTVEELKDVFKKWAIENNKSAEEYIAEDIAIGRLLGNFDTLNALITIIRIDDEIAAFSVNELLPDEMAICHFEKALKKYEGAYAYVINTAARDLLNRGCKTVNWEQDLGLIGLRKAKSSYHPVGFLKKYSITPK